MTATTVNGSGPDAAEAVNRRVDRFNGATRSILAAATDDGAARPESVAPAVPALPPVTDPEPRSAEAVERRVDRFAGSTRSLLGGTSGAERAAAGAQPEQRRVDRFAGSTRSLLGGTSGAERAAAGAQPEQRRVDRFAGSTRSLLGGASGAERAAAAAQPEQRRVDRFAGSTRSLLGGTSGAERAAAGAQPEQRRVDRFTGSTRSLLGGTSGGGAAAPQPEQRRVDRFAGSTRRLLGGASGAERAAAGAQPEQRRVDRFAGSTRSLLGGTSGAERAAAAAQPEQRRVDRFTGSTRSPLGAASRPDRARPEPRPQPQPQPQAPQPAAGGAIAEAVRAELQPRVIGSVLLPGDRGYDEERAAYNTVHEHRPAVLVVAEGAADVIAAVSFATAHGLPVGVLNSGHTASVPADGALLVNTRRMQGVRVDPFTRTARFEAGVRWSRVIHEAAAFGLAPLSGSSPNVGAVGYTLGGGLPLLGRAFGYAADHVRSIDVVTAPGSLRTVTPQQWGDLFWALRGGKGNFGVVTSMEVDLFPVARLFGGSLFFRASSAKDVLGAYRRWTQRAPEEMASSIALTRFPLDPAIPDPLRGRFVTHVRIAYTGSAADGEELVRPLRRAAVPLLDTVADIPYTAAGTIHNDPTMPFPLYERTTYLSDLDEDAAETLLDLTGPDSTSPLRLVELRHLGGALAREPEVPNAVGSRDARFMLYTAAVVPTPSEAAVAKDYASLVMDGMGPWSTGRVCLNFLGAADATPEQVKAAFSPEDYRRLAQVKRAYDPANVFRINHNIPPAATPGAGRR